MAAEARANCDNHAVVHMVVLHGVGHVWPVPPVTPYDNADVDIVRFADAVAAAPTKVHPW
jgi:poly(3-hydroxybutyrate) depolymerase